MVMQKVMTSLRFRQQEREETLQVISIISFEFPLPLEPSPLITKKVNPEQTCLMKFVVLSGELQSDRLEWSSRRNSCQSCDSQALVLASSRPISQSLRDEPFLCACEDESDMNSVLQQNGCTRFELVLSIKLSLWFEFQVLQASGNECVEALICGRSRYLADCEYKDICGKAKKIAFEIDQQ
jgi:hypothetical protein